MKKLFERNLIIICITALSFVFITSCVPPCDSDLLGKIKLPDGFTICFYADNIPGARSLALGENGTLFVSTRGEGEVYAVTDNNGDYVADEIILIDSGLDVPNGVAIRDGDLYVAEVSRVLKYEDIENNLENPPDPIVLKDDLPTEFLHGWKYMDFGPDGKLYFQIGAPCNVCEVAEPFASIVRMNPDGSEFEIFAQGVRNSVGFDWHPETEELWFTDNGRDLLGDDVPPDELNHAPVEGLHFGFPYCHGGEIIDPAFGEEGDCENFTPPQMKLGPHVASLGMKFYTGSMFPKEYKNQIFIAEHGSWNRTIPIGYRITLVRLENNNAVSYEVFAEGWLEGFESWGRPVDVLIMPDGSLLVSDDKAGAVYRIVYRKFI